MSPPRTRRLPAVASQTPPRFPNFRKRAPTESGGDGVAASREIGPVRGRSPPRAQREAAYCGCDIRTRAQAQGLLVEQHCVVDVHNLKFVDPLLDSFWQGYGDEYHSSLTLIGVGP